MIPLFKVFMADDAATRVASTLASGQIAQYTNVEQLESELKTLLDAPHDVLTLNSGTSALHLAYHCAGVKAGQSVIATPMTCAATITPLVHMGAKIHWADVDPLTGLIDPTSVEELMFVLGAENIAAVVAVDWGGAPAPYEILRATVPGEVPIIEDAAHAMLARRGGKSIAAYATENIWLAYSLQAIKHLTTGDGGILVCPNTEQTERARKLRWFGFDRRTAVDFRCAQDLTEAGFKYHMNEIAAAIGLANVARTRWVVDKHRANAKRLWNELNDIASVVCPPWNPDSAWWIFTLSVAHRDPFIEFMRERGIQTSQVHRRNDEHTGFAASAPPRHLPGLDDFAKYQVSIPCGWWLTQSELDQITDAVRAWAKR